MTDLVELEVEEAEDGARLDRLLADRKIASRSELKRWMDEGRVLVDGQPAAPKTRARVGMRVVVDPLPPIPSVAEPEDIPLDIRFQDEHLLIVHKPAGLVVHPAPGHRTGTLVNSLLHHVEFGDVGGDPARPGIVHRLDKDTSGLLVVAKTAEARNGLVTLFQAHDIERRYDAIAVGKLPPKMTFDTLHGRHPKHRKRFSSRVDEGKRAITHVAVQERLHVASRIHCTLETGRTHQIRVHLADHGAPVLADSTYAKRPKDPRLREAADLIGRQALHAGLLGFVHPITGAVVREESEPPAGFMAAVDALR